MNSRSSLRPALVLLPLLALFSCALAAAESPSTALRDQPTEIRVPGYRFDPLLDGEPGLAPEETASSSGLRLRLVQLTGSTLDLWYRSLEDSGARVLQYYPHHSYLIWADESAAAAIAELPFVRWVGLFHPAYKLQAGLLDRTGRIENVAALVYAGQGVDLVSAALETQGATLLGRSRASTDGSLYLLELSADRADLRALAHDDRVVWLGYQSPTRYLDDEMSDQIVAGNHPGGVPPTGYLAHLASLGVDGTGVVWAISDTGVDWDHPDLASRIIGGYSAGDAGCPTPPGQPGNDCGGHGTHVAGIALGDATTGITDGGGFLYGLGMAPGSSIFAMDVFANSVSLADAVRIPLLGGAVGANNSWASSNGYGWGYTAAARTEDILVRDGNLDTTDVAEPFIQVFSAGNSGNSGASTITEPKEAKNIISVANTYNFRFGNIDTVSGSSSRGPALDGRTLPVVAAPGTTIASTANDDGGSCSTAIGGTNGYYAYCSGTSMASPHVAGAVALAVEWWRGFNGGADPSMAMAKALMINGAVDMGTPDIPNNDEGWGRVDITHVVQPDVTVFHLDQGVVLSDSGGQWTRTLPIDDPSKPVRVTLVYSDAAGAAGANPALVNDLDLTVENGGQSYLGNVFSAGWSVTGGSPDALNNVENVYLAAPSAGSVTITVDATNVAGDAIPYNGDPTDQDFALVCSNCAFFADGFEDGTTDAWSNASP